LDRCTSFTPTKSKIMYNHNTQPMHNQDSAIHLHKYTSYAKESSSCQCRTKGNHHSLWHQKLEHIGLQSKANPN
jgi:hypothetical protein